MHYLKVRGFLGIKIAEVQLDGLTVLIGAQAAGKSVMARLVYFFNQYFSDFDTAAVANNEHKKSYDKRKKQEFYQIFPQYSWEKTKFTIKYRKNEHEIEISSDENSSVIEINTSPSVSAYFRSLKSAFKKFSEVGSGSIATPSRIRMSFEFREYMNRTGAFQFEPALFVPAARSFYATIRDEIFSILALDEKIDRIILQFGDFYEAEKSENIRRRRSYPEEYFSSIVKGNFERASGRDWIVMERGRIELSRASSGQQEAVPLLFAIDRFPRSGRTLIIEEPEAHLFPSAQVKILEFMVEQCVSKCCNIMLTTHSPYLLSALNNHILAFDKNEPGGIAFEKVKVYSIEDGISKNLLDEEARLIDAGYIDSVSEEISTKFISLIEK